MVSYDDADEWLAATKGAELRAFDECYPSFTNGNCTVPNWPNPPLVTLGLAGGNIEVTVTEVGLVCPLDAPSGFQVSDLILPNTGNSRVFIEFDPAISAFFTYYNHTTTVTIMEVYDESSTLIRTVTTQPGADDLAIGAGFTSEIPVSRVEIYHLATNADAYIGTGTGVLPGEPTLGSVFITEYGYEVEYDFAVVWTDNPVPPCLGDLDVDGEVGITDFLLVLANWGVCSGGACEP